MSQELHLTMCVAVLLGAGHSQPVARQRLGLTPEQMRSIVGRLERAAEQLGGVELERIGELRID